jgi:hypothetical protein
LLDLRVLHCDGSIEFGQFLLPGGVILELFGVRSRRHTFTTTPEWEMDVSGRAQTSPEGEPLEGIPNPVDLHASRLASKAYWSEL